MGLWVALRWGSRKVREVRKVVSKGFLEGLFAFPAKLRCRGVEGAGKWGSGRGTGR